MSALTMLTLRYTVNGAPVNLPMAGELLFPGLAVTPAVSGGQWQGGWQVVHLATGRPLTTADRAGLCLPCLRHATASPVFKTVDWTVDGETLDADLNAQASIGRLAQVWAGCGGTDCEAVIGLGGGGCSCTSAPGGDDR